MGTALNIIAIVTGLVALFVSALSWHASVQANRSSVFDQRFAVYADVEAFLGSWGRDGRPDMRELPRLVQAWNRSHFLFESSVTAYIRKVWLDAVRADYLNKVTSGQVKDDHNAAVDEEHALTLQHINGDNLRAKFLAHLKVNVGFLETFRALLPWQK